MKKSASSAADRQFALTGPAGKIDRRITPVRGDLACLSLAGRIFAPHYVDPVAYHCVGDHAPIHAEAGDATPILSELLDGEDFALFDIAGDWAWGQTSDGCCGFVQTAYLAEGPGSRANGTTAPGSAAEFAENAIGSAYAPGGRGGAGYDAAGLVRQAMASEGVDLPRFIDLQAKSDALVDTDTLTRGTVLFAGERAAICLSDTEAVTVSPESGVVRTSIADFLATASDEETTLQKTIAQ